MAEFRTMIPTNKGRDLIAKIIAGSSGVQFTRVVTSSTVYTDDQIPALTSISNIKQSAAISKVTKVNTATVKIETALDNTAVTVGYTLATIAVYAIDPDEGEILYGVSGASVTGYVPAYNGLTVSGVYVTLTTAVTNASNVSLTVDPAATATIAEIQTLENEISDIKGYIGYSDTSIYGAEVDYTNKTFTRLAGAIGKTPGSSFDSIPCFGGRKRCIMTDAGIVLAYYGETGYTETGALIVAITKNNVNYPVGTKVQVMVEQPKFYYKVVPITLSKIEFAEVDTIAVTAGASAAGNLTITLDGIAFTVAVLSTDNTAALIAAKIRAATFSGWTVSGSGTSAIFTCNKTGTKVTATFDGASTGVTATVTKTMPGYIGKGHHMRKARYYVSPYQQAGFKIHPAFVCNGKVNNYIYLSAFEGTIFDTSVGAYVLNDDVTADFTVSTGDKLSSINGAKPASGLLNTLTRANVRKLAENRGIGWEQQLIQTMAMTELLFTIEYGSMDMQSKLGVGVTNKTDDGTTSMTEITGATATLGNASGSVTNTNGFNVVSYRGEENFYGNIWKWVDGINIKNGPNLGYVYVADHSFTDDTDASPYSDAGISAAQVNGYISAFAYNESFDWLFIPSETTGSSALPVGDYYYQDIVNSGWRVCVLGGNWSSGSYAGGFYVFLGNGSGNRDRRIGGRLVYIPSLVA
ncbi:hypothetical protein [Oscillibacter sp.]|uniref:hypothetical protein n=1 Tax=Oscillibacter sp. TaxID=1945593 RepID=UPI002636A157|nr:hypothetical protein [Oscillibacter sp.]MDD3347327.1 hypothetical protein [Oscillibacter sp.]